MAVNGGLYRKAALPMIEGLERTAKESVQGLAGSSRLVRDAVEIDETQVQWKPRFKDDRQDHFAEGCGQRDFLVNVL